MTQSTLDDYQDSGCTDYTNAETLRRLYWEEEHTLPEIANICGVSTDTIWRWMNKYDIDRRKSGPITENSDKDGKVDHTDPDVLRQLYHEEGLSTTEIAEKAAVTAQTISQHMEKHNIERRDRVEAARQASRKEYAHRYMSSQGYIEYEDVWDGRGPQFGIHRLLAVAEYGFDAVADKHVHHKNKIPWDNRPDNIEVMTPAEHARHHNLAGDIGHRSND